MNLQINTPLIFGETGLFPAPSSTIADGVDDLFYFILYICLAFFILITGVMIYFVIRFRRRSDSVEKSPDHNMLLEVAWSAVPAVLLAVIFFRGFTEYLDARTPPDNAYEVQVVAKKWSWAFIYPNGYVDNNLHVPADRPVVLTMSSDDVIHSLYVPAFRIKMDVVPGRYSKTWFQATSPGTYRLYCAEYCGTGHSLMDADVVVHPSGEFEPWLANAANFLDELPPAEAGKLLYTRRGCVQCHSSDGSAKAGPTFKNVYGTLQRMQDGEEVEVDENYIRESILQPMAKVRAGYRPVMPTYQGQLNDEEIAVIIQYIKSLSSENK